MVPLEGLIISPCIIPLKARAQRSLSAFGSMSGNAPWNLMCSPNKSRSLEKWYWNVEQLSLCALGPMSIGVLSVKALGILHWYIFPGECSLSRTMVLRWNPCRRFATSDTHSIWLLKGYWEEERCDITRHRTSCKWLEIRFIRAIQAVLIMVLVQKWGTGGMHVCSNVSNGWHHVCKIWFGQSLSFPANRIVVTFMHFLNICFNTVVPDLMGCSWFQHVFKSVCTLITTISQWSHRRWAQ